MWEITVRVSSKARYAVTALVDLTQRETDRPVSLTDIADGQAISFSYLEQMFAALRRAGIVKSVRGPGGGYMLARDPRQISIAEIVAATDLDLVDVSGREQPQTANTNDPNAGRAGTSALWSALDQNVAAFLNSISLHAVVTGGLRSTPNLVEDRNELAATAE